MSDEDPFKNWYQASQPAGEPGGDATRDMTVASPMPGIDSGRSGGAGAGKPADGSAGSGWPAQPPPVSGGDSGYTAPGYGASGYGGAGYDGATRVSPGGTPLGAPGVPGAPGKPARGGRRWRFWGQPGRRWRRITLYLVIVIVLIIAGTAGTYFWIDGKLNRSITLPAFTGTSAGTNWLIVGSDSRTGLTRTEVDKLHLGSVGANASDSLMLLHTGGGKPVLISIPRDSYVPIPGYGSNKINAALAFGGPTLLVKTVEAVTGLRVDHYMGIGFGGLANVVSAVGGVQMCVQKAIPADPTGDSGFKGLAAGCHDLNGTQAIAFVRDRHSFATSDLQRIEDQRAFLKALLSKATSPGVYLNPFTSLPFASTAAGSMSVDKGASLYDLFQVAFALRNPETGTVPISNPNLPTAAGDAVQWNRAEALALFDALKADKPVSKGLLTGTQVGT
jgi:LCP family protein required for cell wall assembly